MHGSIGYTNVLLRVDFRLPRHLNELNTSKRQRSTNANVYEFGAMGSVRVAITA
jgi:hypothetical protein